jgi:enoyl-CoA hydratase/carnithine racemase
VTEEQPGASPGGGGREAEQPTGSEQLAGGKLLLDRPAEAVARLTLNNPEKRNPLDHEVLDAIAAALPRLADGIETRCVVITGTGRAFSAGYDIGAIPEASFEHDAEALVAHPFHAAMDAISAHPYPVLAALNGHALGGGLELAVRCDLRLCAAGAKLGMPPAKLGLIYGHTGLERFIDVIGVAYTKELFLTGRVVEADRAERIGLVNEVVPDDRLEQAALELAAEIATNAPLSMIGNKQAIEMLARFPRLSAEQERELIELRRSCFASEDLREGIRAFAEKRKPNWQGR